MGFNRFYIQVVIRVLLIVVNGLIITFFMDQEDKIMATILSSFLILVQTLLLIKYINKTNSELASFLLRIQSKDTAVNYQDDQIMKSFKGLNLSFNQINHDLKQIRIENEQKSHFLNTIVDHAKIGIIAFNQNGKVELFNPEAQRILHCDKVQFMSTLEEKLPKFHEAILKPFTEKSRSIKLNLNSELINLTLKKTQINIGMSLINIISFQNISRELDHNELESWQKLIQVLNHEIMNSLTPITSLSKVIRRYIQKEGITKKANELNDEIICDIALNTEIIEERGKGLIDFIEVYKSISEKPKLHLTKFKIKQTVQRIEKFYKSKTEANKIIFSSVIDPNYELLADEAMIEQMLINLIKNALEAVEKNPEPLIQISASQTTDDRLQIKIEDNGVGIPASELDKIFIPFYSTKANGSGIGLSLSRQIMYLHKGSISVSSTPDQNTSFILKF